MVMGPSGPHFRANQSGRAVVRDMGKIGPTLWAMLEVVVDEGIGGEIQKGEMEVKRRAGAGGIDASVDVWHRI